MRLSLRKGKKITKEKAIKEENKTNKQTNNCKTNKISNDI